MTDTKGLEIIMLKKGITKRHLARILGLTEQGLRKKMDNITEFKASEIFKMSKILDIPLNSKIFFNE